ncbi:hypothetical protein J8J27_24310, partial [Mycobacterium tuberculosis]|nr:hypothetical protein [Mycobacterium tuberculosis]
FDDTLEGVVRVAVVATGIDQEIALGNGDFDARAAAPASRPAPRPAPPMPAEPVRLTTSNATAAAPQPAYTLQSEPRAAEAVLPAMSEVDPAVMIQRVEAVPTAYAAAVDPIQE